MSEENVEGFRREDPIEVLLTVSGWLEPAGWRRWVRPPFTGKPRILVIYADGIAFVSRRALPDTVGILYEPSREEKVRHAAELDQGRRGMASYREQTLAVDPKSRFIRDGEIRKADAHKGRCLEGDIPSR